MDAAQGLFIAGTIPVILAGGLHALLTLRDVATPTHFAPRDASVKPAMEGTQMRFGGRAAPTMWDAWIGFNFSHGLGAFAFGLVCLLIAIDDFELVERIDGIRPLTIALPAIYFLISLRFWFYGPTLITGASSACFITAALLSA